MFLLLLSVLHQYNQNQKNNHTTSFSEVLPEKQPEINLNTIVNSPKVQEKNVENLNEIINNSQKNSDHKVDDNEKKVLIDDDDEFFDDFFE